MGEGGGRRFIGPKRPTKIGRNNPRPKQPETVGREAQIMTALTSAANWMSPMQEKSPLVQVKEPYGN